MTKKYYLFPAPRLAADNKESKLPTDVRLKLAEFRKDQDENKNQPPHIRPYPLEKYSASKETRIESPEEREREDSWVNVLGDDTVMPFERPLPSTPDKALLKGMPSYAIKRARTLLPHLHRLHLDTLVGDQLRNLLMDLTTNRKKVLTDPPELLQSVIQQLDSDGYVTPSLYKRKIGQGHGIGGVAMSPAHPMSTPVSRGRERVHTSTPKRLQRRVSYIKKPVWN